MRNLNEKNTCHCGDPATLVIDRYSVSRLVAALLSFLFFIFAAGYFLGKRNSAEETILQTERTAFADQLSYAMQSHLLQQDPSVESHEVSDMNVEHHAAVSDDLLPLVEQQETPVLAIACPEYCYQAYLFGGTKKAVDAFAQRLQKKDIKIDVLQRSGRTAKGKVIHWFQAATGVYSNKNDLAALVDTIKKLEKIKDVRNCFCPR